MSTHEEHWAGFPSEFDDAPALVTTDLGWADEGPDRRRRTLVIVRLPIPPNTDAEAGLSEFLEQIEPFDDAVTSELVDRLDAVPVGMLLTATHRWWCFYAPSGEGAPEILEKVADACPGHTPELMVEDDVEWAFYEEVLFPDEAQQRFIADESVVDELQEHGDNGEIPRPIEHLAILPDAEARDQFVEWCSENGFTVTDNAADLDDETDGIGVEFNHVGPAVTEEIWEKTMLASEAAERFGGEYDGWQSAVIKG